MHKILATFGPRVVYAWSKESKVSQVPFIVFFQPFCSLCRVCFWCFAIVTLVTFFCRRWPRQFAKRWNPRRRRTLRREGSVHLGLGEHVRCHRKSGFRWVRFKSVKEVWKGYRSEHAVSGRTSRQTIWGTEKHWTYYNNANANWSIFFSWVIIENGSCNWV